MPDTTEEFDVVLLELHARAAAEAEAAAGQFGPDVIDRDGHARGKPFDDHRQRGSVGFSGGQETQRWSFRSG